MVLSDSEGNEDEEEEEEEEESSSEDETEHLEIERVLDGRPDGDSKQEEFLVKFKGDAPSLFVVVPSHGHGIACNCGLS